MVEIQNSRWLFWVGFFGSFFFFPCLISKATRLAVICSLPWRFHLILLQQRRKRKAGRAPCCHRAPSCSELWGERGSMGLYPTQAMGRFTGSKEGAAGFLGHKSALLLTASVPARCAAHLGTLPWSAWREVLGAGGLVPTCGCTQKTELGFALPPIPRPSTASTGVLMAPGGTVRKHSHSKQEAERPNAAPQPTCPALCPPHTPCRGHNVLHHCQRAQLSSHRFGVELPTATEHRVPSALTLPQWPHCCSTQTAQIYPRAEGSSSPTLATGLWAPGPAQHHHPCTPIPFLLGTSTRRSATRARAPPQTHPPTLPVCALHPGLPQMGSLPRTVPSSSHVPLAGVEGKASGSHWLPFAVSRAPNEHTVISGASRPAPSQNTATLGEALYSQRQTTHICFLTVGIAPSGTGGTGNPLSPSPCD